MGRASRVKRERRQEITARNLTGYDKVYIDGFAKIEARVMAHMLAQYNKQMMHALNYGYGGSMSAALGQNMDAMRTEHPLQYFSGYKFVSFDKRFGHVAVYKTNTKYITTIFAEGERVPETQVWVAGPNVWIVAWTRKSKLADIQHAVAWLLMQDRVAVVARAFEP